jgi:acetyltransferase-like isoleucine patch superfamily enzyme
MMRARLPRLWPDIADWPVLIASLAGVPLFLRRWILMTRGHRFAADVRIHAGTIVHGSRLTIGRGTFINRDCVIQADAPVTIGEDVHFGAGVRITTVSHDIGPSHRRAGERRYRPVTIGVGAWLGAGSHILPGVSVGAGAIVAAGSVVTADVPADTVVGGVPAKTIRSLSD